MWCLQLILNQLMYAFLCQGKKRPKKTVTLSLHVNLTSHMLPSVEEWLRATHGK